MSCQNAAKFGYCHPEDPGLIAAHGWTHTPNVKINRIARAHCKVSCKICDCENNDDGMSALALQQKNIAGVTCDTPKLKEYCLLEQRVVNLCPKTCHGVLRGAQVGDIKFSPAKSDWHCDA